MLKDNLLNEAIRTVTELVEKYQLAIGRLNHIAHIIEDVDSRCLINDGDVPPILLEMTEAEMINIYKSATMPLGKEDKYLTLSDFGWHKPEDRKPEPNRNKVLCFSKSRGFYIDTFVRCLADPGGLWSDQTPEIWRYLPSLPGEHP